MSEKDVNCPYCGEDLYINHDDGKGYDESITHNQCCEHCGKDFVFTTSVSFTYDVSKADCLNEISDHKWRVGITYPPQYAQMKCEICDERRDPTDEERKLYKLYEDE